MSVHFSSKSNEWATPKDFFEKLNKEFLFTLDPCATPENAKCKKYFTEADDGLAQSWDNERVFCNPPYGRGIKDWIKKASEAKGGGSGTTHSSKNRYKLLSRLYIQFWRTDTFFAWPLKVWGCQEQRTFFFHGSYF